MFEQLSKFDTRGVRVATVLSGVHYMSDEERQTYLNKGYIPISDEDYQHYIGNRGTGDNACRADGRANSKRTRNGACRHGGHGRYAEPHRGA